MYVGVLEMYLKCEDICIMYFKYCPVGDHCGFQVGFLKQYFFVGVVVYMFCGEVGSDLEVFSYFI